MKKLITKLAAVACTLTVFGSLTAFSTETVAPQNTIGQTHFIELNNASSHYCGTVLETRVDDWVYYDDGDWFLAGWNLLIRYRYQDTHYYCGICGKEVRLHRVEQIQYSNWFGTEKTDWIYYGENDFVF